MYRILYDPNDTNSPIVKMALAEIEDGVNDGRFVGGIRPKLEAIAKALHTGLKEAWILDGRRPSSIQEALRRDNTGTVIRPAA